MDQALFRRFDDVLHYAMPAEREVIKLLDLKMGVYEPDYTPGDRLISEAKDLSHAEIVRVCDDAIKSSILSGEGITEDKLLSFINERKQAYFPMEA